MRHRHRAQERLILHIFGQAQAHDGGIELAHHAEQLRSVDLLGLHGGDQSVERARAQLRQRLLPGLREAQLPLGPLTA